MVNYCARCGALLVARCGVSFRFAGQRHCPVSIFEVAGCQFMTVVGFKRNNDIPG